VNTYRVKWLQKAIKNLDAEASYIARENPKAANEVVQKIYDAIKLLAQNHSQYSLSGTVPGQCKVGNH